MTLLLELVSFEHLFFKTDILTFSIMIIVQVQEFKDYTLTDLKAFLAIQQEKWFYITLPRFTAFEELSPREVAIEHLFATWLGQRLWVNIRFYHKLIRFSKVNREGEDFPVCKEYFEVFLKLKADVEDFLS